MKSVLLISAAIICFALSAKIGYAATEIVLQDNTLVTNEAVLRALSGTNAKALVVNGSIGDTFAISEDGVLVKTITLEAISEKWVFFHAATSYKVDWSATGTDSASLYLAGD